MSMTKTKRVPAALHAELTDYTNLIRVLRTSRTLDLSTHLLHAAQRRGNENESDTWTPWPLIDCPVPEWSLEDEIKHLGEFVARTQAERLVNQSELHDDDDDDLESLSPTVANRLVLHAGSLLMHILSLMVDQRPSTSGSMQNRLWAMNWEDVISLLAVGGVVNHTVVARAERRLERIYGPSTTKAVERLKSVTSARTTFSNLVSLHDDQLLAPPVLHHRRRRNDAKAANQSRKKRTVSQAVVDTDTDD